MHLSFTKLLYMILGVTIWRFITTLIQVYEAIPQKADSATRYSDESTSFKVAIIGAGAGGSSSAFWISKAAERSNLSISVDIYKQSSHVGGRSFSVRIPVTKQYPYHISAELGAQFFENSHRNMWRASKEFHLPVVALDAQDQPFYSWNGLKLIRMSPSLWDVLGFISYYGHPSFVLGSSAKRAEEVSHRFTDIYNRDYPTWDRPADLVQRLGFADILSSSTSDYFIRSGASKSIVADLILPILGGYTNNSTHALQSLFRMTSGASHHILGGTGRIFEEFITYSEALLYLNTTVESITRVGHLRPWSVNTKRGAKEYDAVILAAPFHQSNIVIPETLSHQIPFVPHDTVHITVLTTQTPFVNTSFLGIPEIKGVRYMTSSMAGRSSHVVFSSITYWTWIGDDGWAVRISSPSALSDEWLSHAFNGQVNLVYRHKWEQPLQVPTIDLAPVRLDEGFYYHSGFESVLSSMETQVVAAQNLVNLLLRDHFGLDVCGTIPRRPRTADNSDFVAGWDC